MAQRSAPVLPLVVVVIFAILIVVLIVLAWFLWQRLPPATKPTASQPVPTVSPQTKSAPRSISVTGPIHWRPTRHEKPLEVLEKRWFTIGYDEDQKDPAWVVYDLSGPITHPGREPTRPLFATDNQTTARVSQHDYSGSHFDRGHMCPAYAMWSRYGEEGFLATFVCSNIIPQPHSVNAGIWEDWEVRIAGRGSNGGWAEQFGQVTVIDGPVLGSHPDHLLAGVAVPVACFSIVVRHTKTGYDALAFEIPDKGNPPRPVDRYLTTIKQIEDDTALDFFAGEAAPLRDALETVRAERVW